MEQERGHIPLRECKEVDSGCIHLNCTHNCTAIPQKVTLQNPTLQYITDENCLAKKTLWCGRGLSRRSLFFVPSVNHQSLSIFSASEALLIADSTANLCSMTNRSAIKKSNAFSKPFRRCSRHKACASTNLHRRAWQG